VLFAKLPIPSEEFAKGLLITSDTLWEIRQRAANTLLHPVINLPEGCQQPMAYCNRVAPITHKGTFLCNTSEESKIQSGVCSTDLPLDTSTKGLKQLYTSTQEI
jgi:hypothetical protein